MKELSEDVKYQSVLSVFSFAGGVYINMAFSQLLALFDDLSQTDVKEQMLDNLIPLKLL